ncbi:TPA: hypothetical protein EYN23_13630, partial [Candidatus Poribacteria bacterium]|nr:hypothetical protein [Candidatus Poribacteria bacterium]
MRWIYFVVLIAITSLAGGGYWLWGQYNIGQSQTNPYLDPPLPGTLGVDLPKPLQNALAEKGTDYKPRTKHIIGDNEAKYTNRLILESSPYLLQH